MFTTFLSKLIIMLHRRSISYNLTEVRKEFSRSGKLLIEVFQLSTFLLKMRNNSDTNTDTSQKYLPTAPLQFDPATNPPFYFSSYTSPICPISMEISLKRRKTAELSTKQRSAIIFGYKNGIS